MEDAWETKLPSGWPLPPPPEATPAPPPPSVPSNQIPLHSRQDIHLVTTEESSLQDRAMPQEPFIFSTLNLGCSQSGKAETGNLMPAFSSGHSRQLTGDFSELQNSMSAPPKLPAYNSGIMINSVNCGIPVSSGASSYGNHGNHAIWSGEISLATSRSMLMPMCARTPISFNEYQVSGSCRQGADSANPIINQAQQVESNGMTASSMRHDWYNSIKPANGTQLHSLNHMNIPKKVMEVKSSIFGHASTLQRGCPLVFCLNTVGELFVSDMGILGVLCLCHSSPMSVAKFCEHSGSSSVSPGNAVRLENGLTLAHWCKLSFGIRIPDDENGWDWPDNFSPKTVPAGSKAISFPLLLKNLGASQSEASGTLRGYGNPWNNYIYVNHSSAGVADHKALEISGNIVKNNVHQGNTSRRSNFAFTSFNSPLQSTMPSLSKTQVAQAMKETPVWVRRTTSVNHHHKGEQNIGRQFVMDDTSPGMCQTPSVPYPSLVPNKSSGIKNPGINRGKNLSEVVAGDRNGYSANIDLRLGQPSQRNQTLTGLIPANVYSKQLDAPYDSQEAESLQLVTQRSKLADLCPTEIDKIKPLWDSSSEKLYSNTTLLQSASGKANNSDHSATDLTDNAIKNSAISLFLSHLNYNEGKNTSQCAMDIVDEGENYLTPVIDNDPLSSRWNSSEFMKNVSDVTEGKSNIHGTNPFDSRRKGKDQRVDDSDCYNTLQHNLVVENMCKSDSGATVGLGNSGYSYAANARFFSYPPQQTSTLKNLADPMDRMKFAFDETTNHRNVPTRLCADEVPHASTQCDSLNLQIPISLSAKNSLYVPESLTAPKNKEDTDITQYPMDENLILLASRYRAELSKLEPSNCSTEASNQHGKLCCLSAVALQTNDNKDIVGPEECRQMPYCSIKNNTVNHFTPVCSCSNSHCGGLKIIAGKPGFIGSDKCCSCSGLRQRISVCCKEHDAHFPVCHPCGSNVPALSRRISNYSATENAGHGMHNLNGHTRCSSGQCNRMFASNCLGLGGSCVSREDTFYVFGEECVCENAKRSNDAVAYDKSHMSNAGKKLKANQCECFRKHVFMENNCQTAMWRDAPNKVIDHSKAAVIMKTGCMLESRGISGNHHEESTVRETDSTHKESKTIEKQPSNFCSRYSAPVVTEISAEIDHVSSCPMDVKKTEFEHDSAIDEESAVEKCGSSDYPVDSRGLEEAQTFSIKTNPQDEEHISASSYKLNEVRNQNSAKKGIVEKLQQLKRAYKDRKRKGPIKWRRLNSYLPSTSNADFSDHIDQSKVCLSSSKEMEVPLETGNEKHMACILSCRTAGLKRKRSMLSSVKSSCWKRLKNDRFIWKNDKSQSNNSEPNSLDDMRVDGDLPASYKQEVAEKEADHIDDEKPPKYMSLCSIKNSRNHEKATCSKKPRPVVCGSLGIISDGLDGQQKPAKILSLELIMKTAKRCKVTKYGGKAKVSLGKKSCTRENNGGCNGSLPEKEKSNGNGSSLIKCTMPSKAIRKDLEPDILILGANNSFLGKNDQHANEISVAKIKTCASCSISNAGACDECVNSQSGGMETHKQVISKLMGEDKDIPKHAWSPTIGEKEFSILIDPGEDQHDKRLYSGKLPKGTLAGKIKCIDDSQGFDDHAIEQYLVRTGRTSRGRAYRPILYDSDAFCCVCGRSNKEEFDHLLECSQCLIKVHQACYGVSKIPRGQWCCRPCKTNSKNIVCVICGYDGGAMTRAVKSRNIVKSLLKVWKVGLEPSSTGESSGHDTSGLDPGIASTSSRALCGAAVENVIQNMNCLQTGFQANNSVIAGLLDPSVIQWVHMVCGLWTPGTRCPNVNTMNAFDVSGALPAKQTIVCSICNRHGGACIRCRVVDCSIHFHPWCAHQKGLLQSEIEGVDNEKVGFYGRCIHHATFQSCHVDDSSMNIEVESPQNKEFSCARTEGYRGRKREQGFNLNFRKPYNDGKRCIVSQDQINAWIHINGQKSFLRRPVKGPCLDVDSDYRKEYIRYKQTKGWKQLVVYKSGIHALGLYTSQFIPRGAMVVEYVGEIVGLRVADKREIEYQSGRKLQYKSACYFFRIDKEHIIDATRKGGIARFVNHSCLPNCVAKIISVRNDKKVVFFAERDINPGEEITYDYHFNHEDEGQKIPCFCNSKNCRRYLN